MEKYGGLGWIFWESQNYSLFLIAAQHLLHCTLYHTCATRCTCSALCGAHVHISLESAVLLSEELVLPPQGCIIDETWRGTEGYRRVANSSPARFPRGRVAE